MNLYTGFVVKFSRKIVIKAIELNVKDNPSNFKTTSQEQLFLIVYCTMKIDRKLKEKTLIYTLTNKF